MDILLRRAMCTGETTQVMIQIQSLGLPYVTVIQM